MAKNAKSVKARIDTRAWDAVRKAIVRTEKRVSVGVLTDSTHRSESGAEISMIELAAIHEFGSPAAGIPERSFLRSTINGQRAAVKQAIEKIVGKAVGEALEIPGGPTPSDTDAAARKALGLLGMKLVSMIRATIRDRATVGPEDQANRPATIARKGSDLPLVDTGQLMQAITYAIVDKGTK